LQNNSGEIARVARDIDAKIVAVMGEISAQRKILDQLNPDKVLERGYALIRGDVEVGNVVEITTFKDDIKAKIMEVKER
jgi:exonuclease VII large subunit